jgi:quercetin dioxygenase-like cupin family protein
MSTRRTRITLFIQMVAALAMAMFLLVAPVSLASIGQARAAGGISTQTVVSVADIAGGGQLVVMRMVFEPGVILAADSRPGPVSFIVISGSLQTTLVRGGAAVNRYGIDQEVELGATMNLNAGTVISYSPNAVKTLVNRGSEPLVVMAMMLLGPDAPMVA